LKVLKSCSSQTFQLPGFKKFEEKSLPDSVTCVFQVG
jgi:hypothetical protein